MRVNFNYLVVIQLHIIKHLIFCMYERRLFSQCLIYYQFASVSVVRLDLSTSQWQHVDATHKHTSYAYIVCTGTAKAQIFAIHSRQLNWKFIHILYTIFWHLHLHTNPTLTDAYAFQQYTMQNGYRWDMNVIIMEVMNVNTTMGKSRCIHCIEIYLLLQTICTSCGRAWGCCVGV